MRIHRIFGPFITLVLLCLIALPGAAAADQRTEICMGSRYQCLRHEFYAYWERHGGLPVFGYPISAVQLERAPSSDERFLSQWLERARFEYHPENAAPYDVLLGRLGVDRLLGRGIDWTTFPKADPATPHYYPQTGHAIDPEFWAYWSTHGLDLGEQGTSERESLALFGYPISPARIETNSSGHTVLTQWFERARFELHPNGAGGTMVLLGLLGNEVRELQPGPSSLPPMLAYIRDGNLSFAYRRSGETHLHEQQLTQGVQVRNFAWSPDHYLLAYTTSSGVHVIQSDSWETWQIATLSPEAASATVELTWSHDSSRVAYTEGGALKIVEIFGRAEPTTIHDAAGPITEPTWSPDGQLIAYAVKDAQGYHLITITPDGRTRTRLTDGRHPSWSYDGQRLAFTRPEAASGTEDLFVGKRDGSDVTRLTTGIVAGTALWSSDFESIAFAGSLPNENGRPRIFTMMANGLQLDTRTTGADIDRHPSWVPGSDTLTIEVQQGDTYRLAYFDRGYQAKPRFLDLPASSTPLMPAWSR